MSATAKTKEIATRPEGYPERVPEFATEQEEREFWDTHDSTYYLDDTEDVTHNPPPELGRGPGRGVTGTQASRRRAHGYGSITVARRRNRRHQRYRGAMTHVSPGAYERLDYCTTGA